MGAIYRRYHEKHKKLRAERAAEKQAFVEKFAEAERKEREQQAKLAAAATEPAPDKDQKDTKAPPKRR